MCGQPRTGPQGPRTEGCPYRYYLRDLDSSPYNSGEVFLEWNTSAPCDTVAWPLPSCGPAVCSPCLPRGSRRGSPVHRIVFESGLWGGGYVPPLAQFVAVYVAKPRLILPASLRQTRVGASQSVPWDSAVKGRSPSLHGREKGDSSRRGQSGLLSGARAQAEGPHEWREQRLGGEERRWPMVSCHSPFLVALN